MGEGSSSQLPNRRPARKLAPKKNKNASVPSSVECWMLNVVWNVLCWTKCWMLNVWTCCWMLNYLLNVEYENCCFNMRINCSNESTCCWVFFSFFLAATPCWIFSGDYFFPVPGAPDRFLAFFAGPGSLPERRGIFPRSLARTRSAGLFLGCSWALEV